MFHLKINLPQKKYGDFNSMKWRYGACCENEYTEPTWKDLVSSAVYDGNKNVIFITAFYNKAK